MKPLVSLFLLLLVALNTTAELTKNDIQEIEKLLDKHDEQMKQYIDLKVNWLNEKINGLMWFIMLLVAIIVGVIALPQAFQIWRERKESMGFDIVKSQIEKMQYQFDMITKEFDTLKKEVTTLKEDRTRLIRP